MLLRQAHGGESANFIVISRNFTSLLQSVIISLKKLKRCRKIIVRCLFAFYDNSDFSYLINTECNNEVKLYFSNNWPLTFFQSDVTICCMYIIM